MKLDIYRFIAGLFESHLDSRVDSVEVQPSSEIQYVCLHHLRFSSFRYGRSMLDQRAGASFIGIYLIFWTLLSGMEIYRKMQVPLSPSTMKIGGENIGFTSKWLHNRQERFCYGQLSETYLDLTTMNEDTRDQRRVL